MSTSYNWTARVSQQLKSGIVNVPDDYTDTHESYIYSAIMEEYENPESIFALVFWLVGTTKPATKYVPTWQYPDQLWYDAD